MFGFGENKESASHQEDPGAQQSEGHQAGSASQPSVEPANTGSANTSMEGSPTGAQTSSQPQNEFWSNIHTMTPARQTTLGEISVVREQGPEVYSKEQIANIFEQLREGILGNGPAKAFFEQPGGRERAQKSDLIEEKPGREGAIPVDNAGGNSTGNSGIGGGQA